MKTNTEAKKAPAHSPLPWRISTGNEDYIVAAKGGIIAHVPAGSGQEVERAEADRVLIVQAVNGLPAFEAFAAAFISKMDELYADLENPYKAEAYMIFRDALALARQSRGE